MNWFVIGSVSVQKKKYWLFGKPVHTGFELRITGHLPIPPQKGDIFHVSMTSGRTLKAKAQSVRYPGDPPDMFFAKCFGNEYI